VKAKRTAIQPRPVTRDPENWPFSSVGNDAEGLRAGMAELPAGEIDGEMAAAAVTWIDAARWYWLRADDTLALHSLCTAWRAFGAGQATGSPAARAAIRAAVMGEAARARADVTHRENRSCRAQALAYWREHHSEFPSKGAAAAHIAAHVVPMAAGTVRKWLQGLDPAA
jgi:hypothetical protein